MIDVTHRSALAALAEDPGRPGRGPWPPWPRTLAEVCATRRGCPPAPSAAPFSAGMKRRRANMLDNAHDPWEDVRMLNSSNDSQDYAPVVLAPLPGELLDKMYRAMPGLDAATADAVYDLVLTDGYSESMARSVRDLHGVRLYEARTGLPF